MRSLPSEEDKNYKKVLHGEGDDAMQAAHKKQSWPCCSVQEGSTLLGRREHA